MAEEFDRASSGSEYKSSSQIACDNVSQVAGVYITSMSKTIFIRKGSLRLRQKVVQMRIEDKWYCLGAYRERANLR